MKVNACKLSHIIRQKLSCTQSRAMRLAWQIVKLAGKYGYEAAFKSVMRQEKREIRNSKLKKVYA